jgi:hypothetical protein
VVNGSDWPKLVAEQPGMEAATPAKKAKSP